MTDNKSLKFSVSVVCEYPRHWDTHKMLEIVGEYTDSAVDEIDGFNGPIRFAGNNSSYSESFKINHFLEGMLPSKFTSILKSEEDKQGTLPIKYGYIVFSSEIFANADQYRDKISEIRENSTATLSTAEDDLIDLYKFSAVLNLDMYVSLFSISANIAKPSSFNLSQRFLFVNDELVKRHGEIRNTLQFAVEAAQNYDWPKIRTLSLFDVWDWIIKVPGFSGGETKSSLGRAIGALSYLLGSSKKGVEDLDLVWALVGLESLYGETNVGLKTQLMDKSEIILGKRETHKKVFGDIYDFRSRFVHGDKNFCYNGFDSVLEQEYQLKMLDSEAFSSAVLISTLQEMCSRKLYDLKFELSLSK